MITKRNRLAVACLITVAVISLGIAYAQDATARVDRADASRSLSYSHEEEGRHYLIGPHQTIQDAVDNAKTGDTIILRPRVYK